MSSIFGIPCALANMIPMSALGMLPQDISIPKLLWLESESRFLRFDEVMDLPLANYRNTDLYVRAGVRVVENSAEDILELVLEMLDRLEGRYRETEKDRRLQERYRKLLRLGHYSYGAASQVATTFLRKYQHMLASEGDVGNA